MKENHLGYDEGIKSVKPEDALQGGRMGAGQTLDTLFVVAAASPA